MNTTLLNQIVNAVLYEGYVLYPYRPTSKKNQRERFTFGRVYPPAYSAAQNGLEPCVTQVECLLRCPGDLGLSEPVQAAVPNAIALIESLLRKLLDRKTTEALSTSN